MSNSPSVMTIFGYLTLIPFLFGIGWFCVYIVMYLALSLFEVDITFGQVAIWAAMLTAVLMVYVVCRLIGYVKKQSKNYESKAG